MGWPALHVIVVEDHGFQRRIALRLLADLGVQDTAEASDGEAALALLRGRPTPPDIALVDLDMPGMDGIELIGHLAQERLARAVVVVSALDPALLHTVQTMARAYGLRVLGSVEKPLTRDNLGAMLQRYGEAALDEAEDGDVEVDLDTLLHALEAGEIVPWFQPQVEFANGKLVGAEALARWERPDGNVVRPALFVPVLEREGHADALAAHMLDRVCACKASWGPAGAQLKLSVNISPGSLADARVADHYQAIVEAHGVRPEDIVLEITEGSLLTDAARGLGVLARLRLKGFGLSIDDFGTGYSSLAQLSRIPFTELKIDKEFVSGAHVQPRKRAVVEASLDLAGKMGLLSVAEGVETLDDWQMLAELGCDVAQGWLIGHAVPASELLPAVARWRRPGH